MSLSSKTAGTTGTHSCFLSLPVTSHRSGSECVFLCIYGMEGHFLGFYVQNKTEIGHKAPKTSFFLLNPAGIAGTILLSPLWLSGAASQHQRRQILRSDSTDSARSYFSLLILQFRVTHILVAEPARCPFLRCL